MLFRLIFVIFAEINFCLVAQIEYTKNLHGKKMIE